MLKKNVSKIDRSIRILIAAICLLILLFNFPVLGSILISILVACFGLLNLIAAITGVCFGYLPFQISTRKVSKERAKKNGS
jgi:hypothetical protein